MNTETTKDTNDANDNDTERIPSEQNNDEIDTSENLSNNNDTSSKPKKKKKKKKKQNSVTESKDDLDEIVEHILR
jgi:hypothetical protein